MPSDAPCCRECRPDLFPSGPCQGEHHVAIRFGDHALPLWVYLDGVKLRNCTEAICGNALRDSAGLAVVMPDNPVMLCPCGSGMEVEEIRRGLVEVTNQERKE